LHDAAADDSDALLQVLNLNAHKRAVVDVQWNLHDVNVIASGASDGSIALIDIRHPHHVIQSMSSSEGMACLRLGAFHFADILLFCFTSVLFCKPSQVASARIFLPSPGQRSRLHGASVGHPNRQNSVVLYSPGKEPKQ
jgi:WD40 repeat protein